MKNSIYIPVLVLVVTGGLVYAHSTTQTGHFKEPVPKPITVQQRQAAIKAWEKTPGGIAFKKWETSAAGKKVLAGAAKMRKPTRDSTAVEGTVTALSLPPGARLGLGVMVDIDGDAYILAFGPENPGNRNEMEPLHTLRVNDKIMIQSHSVSYAPKYFYPIIAGDFIERDKMILYKRAPRKGGC